MRKSKDITLDDRGVSKTFRITEMSAYQFEWWVVQAGRLLASCGAAANVDVGEITDSATVQETLARFLVTDGLKSLGNLDLDKVKPLYDELLKCCAYKSGQSLIQLDPDTVDGVIEDFRTLFTLRKEALMLHIDFFPTEGRAGLTGQTAPASGMRGPQITAV